VLGDASRQRIILEPRRLPSARRCSGRLDGRIARMTNTVSDFGREMDSLA
jgi:hypothetical protein